jgi:hypothetical protein
MKQTINTPQNLNKLPSEVNNFDTLNCKEVNIWWDKIAWTFAQINLDEEYGQVGSREYPSTFYIRTKSDNIYHIFVPTYANLWELTKGNDQICQQILSRPTRRCIFNPRTRKIIGVQNPKIKCGESFAYAPKCTTTPLKEIVGVSDSQWGDIHPTLVSTIEQDFNQQKKK